MSGYRFRRMTDEEAAQISGWHYESPYDATSDADDLQELLDPKSRKDAYFERAGKTVDVGLGMRPDLTGEKLGVEYLFPSMAREA
jgi:[ribosomal protein S18]-alanine N-acetyltransferase